jgi:hypothetical protein
MRLGDGEAALQLRSGVGVDSDGHKHAEVGGQVGMWAIGIGMTARREFDTGDTVVSLNVELTALTALLPVGIAALATMGGAD